MLNLSNEDTKTHYVINGKLEFEGDQFSDSNRKIDLYTTGYFGRRYFLASGKTDEEGKFSIPYFYKAGCWRTIPLIIDVMGKVAPFSQEGLWGINDKVLIAEFPIQAPANQNEFQIQNPLRHSPTSDNIEVVDRPAPGHMQSAHYFYRFAKAAFPELLKRGFITVFQKLMTTERVQKIYNSFGPQYPRRDSTDDHLIFELLNEIAAVAYEREGDQIVWKANWDAYTFDRINSLPNVEVTANYDQDEDKIKLEQIVIQFRNFPERIVNKESPSALQEWARFVARSVFALKGEGEVHLAEGHILPSLAAKAFMKYITESNPLYSLITPHINQLDFINWLGSQGIIFGTGSVLEMSSLTPEATSQMIIDSMKKRADFTDNTPPDPLCESHYLARCRKQYHELLTTYFTEYVENNWESIKNHWHEIYKLSESTHKKFESIPKITQSDTLIHLGDQNRLIQFLVWLVSKTTFIHWAAHSRQYMLTHIDRASLCLEDITPSEENFDPFQYTHPMTASRQEFIARLLLNFDGDALIENPYGDVNKELLSRIQLWTDPGMPDLADMHITTQI